MSEFKNNMKDLFKGCLTIPNFLSVIRILLIPVFAVLFLKDYVIAAVVVIILAELTDLFDGKIARKFNQVSALGKLLDPIADKLSQMAIVIVLIVKYWDNAIKYLFMFFILKEILMIIGGAILLSKGLRPVAAEMWGKVATTVFCIVMIFILAFGKGGALCGVTGFTLPDAVTWALVTISAICTLASLLGYAPGFIRQIKEKKAQSEKE
ncbi:MAG: CDP-alcohol phosphatidyltransferase family protein [Eubacterium sp.]|nr:CDP-alcohol phosphatidyltransferase family protein [Eubacterium sp.]